MQAPPQTDTAVHRVILFASQGEELLVLSEPGRLRLPEVSIPTHQRIAKHLTESVYRDWSEHAVSLFGLETSSTDSETRYEVMESTDAQRSDAATLRRVSLSFLREHQFEEPADALAVARAIAECKEYAAGSKHGPFGRLGWFAELTEWVRDQIRSAGLQLNGPFAQLNASPTFSLVHFETNGPPVWFKAVGEPNLHEYGISQALARLLPSHVPTIIAAKPGWNGWLMADAGGVPLNETRNHLLWRSAIEALGTMQLESIATVDELMDAGCRNMQSAELCELVDPFLEAMTDLMGQQGKIPPNILTRVELDKLGTSLKHAIHCLAALQIPETLGHKDFNPGNIIVGRERCVFIDWAEAHVSHPFLTFEYFLAHLRKDYPQLVPFESDFTVPYSRVWSAVAPPEQIAEAYLFSPLVAVFAYAAGSHVWRDPERLRTPGFQAYLRSLTRKMKQEADLMQVRGVKCLN